MVRLKSCGAIPLQNHLGDSSVGAAAKRVLELGGAVIEKCQSRTREPSTNGWPLSILCTGQTAPTSASGSGATGAVHLVSAVQIDQPDSRIPGFGAFAKADDVLATPFQTFSRQSNSPGRQMSGSGTRT